MTVRARERTAPPAEPSAPPSSKPESSATSSDAPTQALIVHGPPPQAAPASRLAGKTKALLGFGLLLGVGAIAVAVRLYLLRKALPAGLGKDDLRMPKELGFKEPIGSP